MNAGPLSVIDRIHKKVNRLKNLRAILIGGGLLLLCLLLPKGINAWIAPGILTVVLSRVLFFQIQYREILSKIESLIESKERVVTLQELEEGDSRKTLIENQIEDLLRKNPSKLSEFSFPSILIPLLFFLTSLGFVCLDYYTKIPPNADLLKKIEEQTKDPKLSEEVRKEFSSLKTAIETHGLGSKEVDEAIQITEIALMSSQESTPTPTATPTATSESNPSPSPTVQSSKESKDGGKQEESSDKGESDKGGEQGGDSGKGEGKDSKGKDEGEGQGKEKKDNSTGEGKGEQKNNQSDAQKTLSEAKKEQEKASEEQKKSTGDKKEGEGNQDSQNQKKDETSKEGEKQKSDAKPSKGESGEKGEDKENKPKGEGEEKPGAESNKNKDDKERKDSSSPKGEGGKLSSEDQAPEGKLEDEGEGASTKEKKIDEVSVPGIDEKLNTEEVGKEGRLTNKEEESAYKRKLEEMNDMKSNPALESGNQYIPKEYERYINE